MGLAAPAIVVLLASAGLGGGPLAVPASTAHPSTAHPSTAHPSTAEANPTGGNLQPATPEPTGAQAGSFDADAGTPGAAELSALADGGYPDDPFADEYLPPVAREYGTAAGQIRVVAAVGLVGLDPNGLVSGAVEAMPSAWLGARISASAGISDRTTAPHLIAVSIGPALHPFPYRRVELVLGFEGGLALLDVWESTRTLMPVIAGRAELNVWITPALFLRLTSELLFGIYPAPGRTARYLHPGLLLGIGYAL